MNHHSLILSLGSNVADRECQLQRCLERIRGAYRMTGCSTVYSTPPLSGEGSAYSNAVVAIDSCEPLEATLAWSKDLERQMGRDDEARRAGSVPIDIDIVVADGEVLRQRDFSAAFFQIGYLQLK